MFKNAACSNVRKMNVNFVLQLLFVYNISYVSQALTGHFYLFGDFHLDPSYWTTQGSCNEEISRDELGTYGNYNCDPPHQLIHHAAAKLKEMLQETQADFIIWMGDAAAHWHKVNPAWTLESKLELIQNVTNLLKDNFKEIPVIPVLGNHDYHPKDMFAADYNNIYEQIATMWKDWLVTTEAKHSFRQGGYYSHIVGDKLRLIVLNTNLYLPADTATEGINDPAGQFIWLDSQLTKAASNQEKVHLIMHVPTGAIETSLNGQFFMRSEQSDKLTDIILQYHHIIVAVHAAHEHSDAFRLFYQQAQPVTTLFISPSITPWRWPAPDYMTGRNPAMRRVDYNTQTKQITNLQQFYMNLTDANQDESDDPEWKLEYSFRDTYNLPDMSPASINKLLTEFKEKGNTKFELYYKYNHVSLTPQESPHLQPCSCQCKQAHLCAIEFMKKEAYVKCQSDETPCA